MLQQVVLLLTCVLLSPVHGRSFSHGLGRGYGIGGGGGMGGGQQQQQQQQQQQALSGLGGGIGGFGSSAQQQQQQQQQMSDVFGGGMQQQQQQQQSEGLGIGGSGLQQQQQQQQMMDGIGGGLQQQQQQALLNDPDIIPIGTIRTIQGSRSLGGQRHNDFIVDDDPVLVRGGGLSQPVVVNNGYGGYGGYGANSLDSFGPQRTVYVQQQQPDVIVSSIAQPATVVAASPAVVSGVVGQPVAGYSPTVVEAYNAGYNNAYGATTGIVGGPVLAAGVPSTIEQSSATLGNGVLRESHSVTQTGVVSPAVVGSPALVSTGFGSNLGPVPPVVAGAPGVAAQRGLVGQLLGGLGGVVGSVGGLVNGVGAGVANLS